MNKNTTKNQIQNLDLAEQILKLHFGGKISTAVNYPVQNLDELSKIYSPGVGQVCALIATNKTQAEIYTIKQNTVAVISDGSAVLGLGDIGPEAAMPVMEGKAMLFKQLAGINAFPICLDTQDVDEIVKTIKNIAPSFAGINLEDISAPRCFEIESRLEKELAIPVMHDDQHGTAVVVLAALYNSLELTGRKISDIKVTLAGAGAAGIATTKLLLAAGVKSENILLTDRQGSLYRGRENLNKYKQEIAEITNSNLKKGSLSEVVKGADVFIGLAGPNLLSRDDVLNMNSKPIIFALSNPNPEIKPEEVADICGVLATGRSDYPNQINNVLIFPGFFAGLIKNRVKKIETSMKLSAAKSLADYARSLKGFDKNNILPQALDLEVPKIISAAVK